MSEDLARKTLRVLAAVVALVVAFFVQTVLFPGLEITTFAPDLILGAVVAAALVLQPIPAILVGAGAGLLQDAFAGGLLGLNGFSKPLLAFGVVRVQGLLRLGSMTAAGMVVTVAVVPDTAIQWGLRAVTAAGPISPERWTATLYGLPLTAGFGLLTYRVLARWNRGSAAGDR